MKKTLLALAIVAALAAGQNAYATPVTQTFADTAIIWDGWSAQVNDSTSENIGFPKIESTSVSMDEHTLTKIVFNLSETYLGVDSGDLFIDANADKTWDYVVKTLNYGLNTTSTAYLYAINAGLTDFGKYETSAIPGGRIGHATGLEDMTAASILGTVSYVAQGGPTYSPGFVSFDFAGLNAPLSFTSDFIIGYTFTCANDVVYEQVPVPEPGTFAMLGAGLLGLGLFARRKKQL